MTSYPPADPTGTGGELHWAAVAAAVVISLVGADFLLPNNNLSGALVVAPFLASGGARPRGVACVGALAGVAAIGLAFSDNSGLSPSAVRIAVIVIGTVAAMRAASLRIRRQERLVDLSTVAETAQLAIIQKPDAEVGSVAVATWYQSSARTATVGGDCYEILATPYGTRAIVADVRGHGLPSVRLAALVLGAFRALAHIERDLRIVARELDLLVARYAAGPADGSIDGEEFVTAALCQVNGLGLSVANCGHPAPLLVNGSGEVVLLWPSAATFPLGLGADPVLDTWALAPRTRLLLYTDGLIEAVNGSRSYFDLAGAAASVANGSLEDGVAALVNALNAHSNGKVNDDVAIMLLEPLEIEDGSHPSRAQRSCWLRCAIPSTARGHIDNTLAPPPAQQTFGAQ